MKFLKKVKGFFNRLYIVVWPRSRDSRWQIGIFNPCRSITLFTIERGCCGGIDIIFLNIEVFRRW